MNMPNRASRHHSMRASRSADAGRTRQAVRTGGRQSAFGRLRPADEFAFACFGATNGWAPCATSYFLSPIFLNASRYSLASSSACFIKASAALSP